MPATIFVSKPCSPHFQREILNLSRAEGREPSHKELKGLQGRVVWALGGASPGLWGQRLQAPRAAQAPGSAAPQGAIWAPSPCGPLPRAQNGHPRAKVAAVGRARRTGDNKAAGHGEALGGYFCRLLPLPPNLEKAGPA